MIIDEDKKRIESINRMIIELSSGNFSYSINRSDNDDELETSIMLLNMMAEEIREYFRHQDFVHTKDTYLYAAQMNFLLDKDYKIKNFSRNLKDILLLENNELLNKSFPSLLLPSSQKEWCKTVDKLKEHPNNYLQSELFFKSENNLSIPLTCSLSRMEHYQDNIEYCLTAFQTVANNKQMEHKFYNAIKNTKRNKRIDESAKKVRILKRESDIRKIKKVYQYILENLDEPLLSLKELAHSVGTNEFKLKIGFRQLYNTSVFRFQTEERLKKAHLLIRNTDMALKTIAHTTGFKSFPHFSKTFKKRFGYNPSELKKQSREENI